MMLCVLVWFLFSAWVSVASEREMKRSSLWTQLESSSMLV